MSEAQALFEGWYELSQDDKRAVVEAITERITIEKDVVAISLRSDPPTPPSSNDPAPSSGSSASAADR